MWRIGRIEERVVGRKDRSTGDAEDDIDAGRFQRPHQRTSARHLAHRSLLRVRIRICFIAFEHLHRSRGAPVSLLHLVGVGGQHPCGVLESLGRLIATLAAHVAVALDRSGHVRVLGLEVVLEPRLLLGIVHLDRYLPGSLPFRRANVLAVLELELHVTSFRRFRSPLAGKRLLTCCSVLKDHLRGLPN